MSALAKWKTNQIVKVQIAVAGDPGVLVYNEDRSVEFMQYGQDAAKTMLRSQGGKPKAYWHATHRRSDGKLVLDKLAEEQDW
jgi:hypothetical protein